MSLELKPEIICDHEVTLETKKLWNVLMDLFDQLDRICKKYNIRYFASDGTLLGAVRHQGFIPWDDDMDFFMLGPDYVRFLEVAPKELQEPYYLQSYQNEGDTSWPDIVLIRRSDTTGCTERTLQGYFPPANLGIFIDIFPLTFIPKNKAAYQIHTFIIRAYRKAFRGHEKYCHAKYKGELSVKSYLNSSFLTWKFMSLFSRDYKQMCRQFLWFLLVVRDSGTVGLKSYFTNNRKYYYPGYLFDEVIELPFEDRQMPCPKRYDELLKLEYGDYMKFVKGSAMHTMTIVDTEESYLEKIKKGTLVP